MKETDIKALLDQNPQPSRAEIATALCGNLCRCTGYTPILEAGLKCNDAEHSRLGELYPTAPMIAELQPHASEPVRSSARTPISASSRASSASIGGRRPLPA